MKCGLNFMARKIHTLELGPAARDKSAANQRQRTLLVAALDFMKSRTPMKRIAPPRLRLQIVVEEPPQTQMVEPVKIRHAG
jgi:hypothetical protein